MRRIISLFIVCVFLLMCFGRTLCAFAAENVVNYYINEDFSNAKSLEDVTSSGTISYNLNKGKVSVVETFIKDDDPIDESDEFIFDGFALRSEATETSYYDDMPHIIAKLPVNINSGKVVVETRVRSFVPIANCMVVLRNKDGGEFLSTVFRTSMKLDLGGVEKFIWEEEKWYDLKYVLDFDNKVIDGYINDEMFLVNHQSKDMTNLDNVFFRAWVTPPNTAAMEIKYVKVYEAPSQDQALQEQMFHGEYAEALQILSTLGVWGECLDNFDPDNKILRKEFAEILPRLFGLSDSDISALDGINFKDIPQGSALEKYTDYASSAKLMIGKGNELFAPDDEMLCQEAIKVLLVALNYGNIAERIGYPIGYLNVADEVGLLKNVKGEFTNTLTCGDLVYLLHNALNVEFPIPQEVQGNYTQFKTYEGVTVMSEYFDMHTDTGIVTANSVTSLSTPSNSVGELSVKIDDNIFDVDSVDYGNYIGMNVRYYYVDDGSSKTIKYMLPYKTQITDVNADDINNVKTEQSNGKYFYYYDGEDFKEKRISFDRPYVIYNGKAYDDAITGKIFCPKSGSVKLIDNNNDGKIDVVSITSYQNILVSTANSDLNTIYGVYGEKIELGTDYRISRAGAEITIDDIVKNDVVAVTQSVNKTGSKYVTVTVVREKVSGSVSGEIDDSIILNEKEYRFSKSFLDYIGSGKEKRPTINTSGFFFLDIEGKIIGVDTGINSYYKTGYLIATQKEKGLSNSLILRVLTSSGKVEILNTASKVRVNDTVVKNREEILTLLSETAVVGLCDQLIRYRLNSENLVTIIDTNCFAMYNPEQVPLNQVATEHYYRKDGRVFYRNVEYTLQKPFTVTDKTVGFYVPSLNASDKDYDTMSFENVASDYYQVEAYNLSDTGCAEFVVFRDYTRTIESGATMFLVDEVFQIMTEDDDITYKVTGYQNGIPTTLIMDPETNLELLEQGDVIQYLTNRRGQVDFYQKQVSAPTFSTAEKAKGGYGETEIVRYGKLANADDNNIMIEAEGNLYPFSTLPLSNILTVVDLQKGDIKLTGKDSLSSYTIDKMPNARIFALAYQGILVDAFVYLLKE